MTETIRCPNCGGDFSSTESYQDHLPCGSEILGGSGDVRTGSQESVKKGGTGEYD